MPIKKWLIGQNNEKWGYRIILNKSKIKGRFFLKKFN